MEHPKVSIITVCYNSAETIEQTIKSVLMQTYDNIEYIIVDGKSSDGTMNIVNRHQNGIAKVVSEKDNGIFDAFNKGVGLASGEITTILNSDDFYIKKDAIEKVVELFQEKEVDSVYADLVCVNWDDTDKITRYVRSGEYHPRRFEFGWMPTHPTFFVRREAYEKYGNFNTWMKISNDYELILRFLYKHKLSAAYLPEVILKMREGGNSSGSLITRYKANMEDRQSWKVNKLKAPFYAMYMKPLRKLPQFIIPRRIKKEVNQQMPELS